MLHALKRGALETLAVRCFISAGLGGVQPCSVKRVFVCPLGSPLEIDCPGADIEGSLLVPGQVSLALTKALKVGRLESVADLGERRRAQSDLFDTGCIRDSLVVRGD